jgi:integrase
VSITTIKGRGGRKRYRVRHYENGRSGRRLQKTFDRREDAERFETAVRRASQLGQLVSEVVGSEQTVSEFTREWWEKYAEPSLAPGTLASYAYVLDKWVEPYVGRLRLRDVTRETVDEYRSRLVRAGAGAPTVNRALAILEGIFSRAVEWGRLPANPFARVRKLTHVRDEAIDARMPDDVEAIRRVLGPRDATLVSVLAYQGLRPQEAFALEWRDVVDDRGRTRERLRVQRALSDQTLSTTKNHRTREPELLAPVARDLAGLYLRLGRPDVRTLVFPDAVGGYLRRQNWRRRVWIPALAAVWPCSGCSGTGRRGRATCPTCRGSGSGRYFRPYDLRHTAATLLIYEGRPVVEVAEHLGHRPTETLRTYAHVLRDGAKLRGKFASTAILEARRPDRDLGFGRG